MAFKTIDLRCNCNISWIFAVLLCAQIVAHNAYVIHSEHQQTVLKWENNEEIQLFREYLRIPTVHPNVDYKPAVEFLKKQAASLNLPVSIYYPVDDESPVVVMKWEGSQPELPSIMLNSHMDVVPVYREFWTHPPFAAEMEENGDIYARGAQDTKCIGMQYLAAIRSLKRQGIDRLKRNIYIVFVPDEEVGGKRGMIGFVKSTAFERMRIGFALDEGNVALDDGTLTASYVERTLWQIELIIHGQSGDGSKLLDNTPGEKLNYVLNKLTEYRNEERRKLKELHYQDGNVTSINLTRFVKGGIANNVIPAELSAVFDIRVSVNTDIIAFEQQINRWCEEAGGNITIKTLIHGPKQKATRVDNSNPFWVAFKSGVEKAGYTVKPDVMDGTTDMIRVRQLNISAISFSPLINTVNKMHDHNEYLNADTYLVGIEIYKRVIVNLGNV